MQLHFFEYVFLENCEFNFLHACSQSHVAPLIYPMYSHTPIYCLMNTQNHKSRFVVVNSLWKIKSKLRKIKFWRICKRNKENEILFFLTGKIVYYSRSTTLDRLLPTKLLENQVRILLFLFLFLFFLKPEPLFHKYNLCSWGDERWRNPARNII